MNNTKLRIIRKPLVLEKLGISKSTLQNWINQKLLPEPVSLGARAVGFVEQDIDTIIRLRILGASNDVIKHAVREIHEERKLLKV